MDNGRLSMPQSPVSSYSFLEGSGQLRDLDTVMGKARYFGEKPERNKQR